MFDFNDAAPQTGPKGELIPDGSFVKLCMKIRPGRIDGATQMDAGLLKASNSSDAKMLDCEFMVMDGPHAQRKLWENFVVDGGKRNDQGVSIGWNMTKSKIRAMIESATGLDPKDESPEAKKKRTIQGLKQLDGISFAARVMVEPATSEQYSDQNKIANIVLPGDSEYQPIMTGQPVTPKPVNAKPRKEKPASTNAGWQSQGNQPADDAPSWLNG